MPKHRGLALVVLGTAGVLLGAVGLLCALPFGAWRQAPLPGPWPGAPGENLPDSEEGSPLGEEGVLGAEEEYRAPRGAREKAVEPDPPDLPPVFPLPTPARALAPLPVGQVRSGQLVYVVDGRALAEERYRLERGPQGEVLLASEGSFGVRLGPFPVNVAFRQEVLLGEDLQPQSYRLETRGPLGLGSRRVEVRVEGAVAWATFGRERQEIAVPAGLAFFPGTGAAYAVLPLLWAAWAAEEGLVLSPVWGGTGLGRMGTPGRLHLVSEGTVAVALRGQPVELQRIRVQTEGLSGLLFVQDLEFVALVADDPNTLSVYRADLLPGGVASLGLSPRTP